MNSERDSEAARIVTSPLKLGTWLGRNGRAILGAVVIIFDMAMFTIDTINGERITMPDVAIHLGMLVAGIALIDREKVADIIRAWKGY